MKLIERVTDFKSEDAKASYNIAGIPLNQVPNYHEAFMQGLPDLEPGIEIPIGAGTTAMTFFYRSLCSSAAINHELTRREAFDMRAYPLFMPAIFPNQRPVQLGETYKVERQWSVEEHDTLAT